MVRVECTYKLKYQTNQITEEIFKLDTIRIFFQVQFIIKHICYISGTYRFCMLINSTRLQVMT